MASRKEICSGCGVQLLLPTEAQTVVRCAVCKAITKVGPANPLLQAQDSIHHAANRFKTIINTVIPTNIPLSSYNNYAGASCYAYYPQPTPLQPPPPPPPAQFLMPPSAHGRKRAVLCGVSYLGRSYQIKGSVNDITCMRYFLVERMGFPTDSILVLTEYETDPLRIPTKQNIRMAMQWLVHGSQPGDSLVFHYSGHGSRQPDYDMDELDGYDETLCPVDYESQGMIVDDEVNATLVRPLPQGTTLHAIIDACYSATVLDLPFLCKMNREGYYLWQDHRRQSHYKGTNGGVAVCISSCDDHQTSADTTALSGNVLTGAMTYSFIQAVQNEPGLTYGRLLNAMRFAIREAKTGIRLKGPIASLLNKLLATDLSQEPQISSSEKFDIYMKQFVL